MPQGSVRVGAEREVPVRSSYSVSLNNRKAPCAASLNAFAATFRRIIGVGEEGAGFLIKATLMRSVFDDYRPELHYMRGPGPRWLEKHGATSPTESIRRGWLHSVISMLRPRRGTNRSQRQDTGSANSRQQFSSSMPSPTINGIVGRFR